MKEVITLNSMLEVLIVGMRVASESVINYLTTAKWSNFHSVR